MYYPQAGASVFLAWINKEGKELNVRWAQCKSGK